MNDTLYVLATLAFILAFILYHIRKDEKQHVIPPGQMDESGADYCHHKEN